MHHLYSYSSAIYSELDGLMDECHSGASAVPVFATPVLLFPAVEALVKHHLLPSITHTAGPNMGDAH